MFMVEAIRADKKCTGVRRITESRGLVAALDKILGKGDQINNEKGKDERKKKNKRAAREMVERKVGKVSGDESVDRF